MWPSLSCLGGVLKLILTWSIQMEWEVMCLLLHHLMASTGPYHLSWPNVKSSVVSLAVVKHCGMRVHTLRPHPCPPVWGAADLVAAGDLH